MRDIIIGDAKMRVRATPLALLYYKQEFKADMVSDLLTMQGMATDPAQFDSLAFLQIIWAMAKAAVAFGKPFPSFAEWVASLELFDFADQDLMIAVMDEAIDGFFRGGRPGR